AAWPLRKDGGEATWRIDPRRLSGLIEEGYVKLGKYDPRRKTWTILYLSDKTRTDIAAGKIEVIGKNEQGVVSVKRLEVPLVSIKTVWHRKRHNAGAYGTSLLQKLLGEQGAF